MQSIIDFVGNINDSISCPERFNTGKLNFICLRLLGVKKTGNSDCPVEFLGTHSVEYSRRIL